MARLPALILAKPAAAGDFPKEAVMTRDKKTVKHSEHDDSDTRQQPTRRPAGQAQHGDQAQRGTPNKQQQQQPTTPPPTPGGGEPEVQENLPDSDRVGDRGSRNPQVDVERP